MSILTVAKFPISSRYRFRPGTYDVQFLAIVPIRSAEMAGDQVVYDFLTAVEHPSLSQFEKRGMRLTGNQILNNWETVGRSKVFRFTNTFKAEKCVASESNAFFNFMVQTAESNIMVYTMENGRSTLAAQGTTEARLRVVAEQTCKLTESPGFPSRGSIDQVTDSLRGRIEDLKNHLLKWVLV